LIDAAALPLTPQTFMQVPKHRPHIKATGWALGVASVGLLWLSLTKTAFAPLDALEQAGFFWLLAIELAATVVAMLIFLTAYRAMLSARQGAVVLLGVSFLGVGLLGFLHVLSLPGMPDASSASSFHKSVFFDLAAQLLAAVSMLIYVWLPPVPHGTPLRKRLALTLMVSIVVSLAYVGLVEPEQAPAMLVEDQGVTPLNAAVRWLIAVVCAGAVLVLRLRRAALARECLMALGFSAGLLAVSSLFYALATLPAEGSAVVLGHVYKLAALLFLLHATMHEALLRPLERMEIQLARESQVLNASPDGILWANEDGVILMANPAVAVLSGYAVHELVGQHINLLLPPQLHATHAQAMATYFCAPSARAMGDKKLKLLRRDGVIVPVAIALGHWEDSGVKHAIAYIRDLREREEYEESLRHQSTHDTLTGLPNRWLFHLHLSQSLAHAKRTDRHVAVLMLDLDDFKMINDSFGHAFGDDLLIQIGIRLQALLPDGCLLARLGGDEFAILLPDLNTIDDAIRMADLLLASFDVSFRIEAAQVHASCSIGMSFYPEDAQDGESLLRFADMAMYQSKQSGRGGYACYSPELDQRAQDNMVMHVRLKEALRHNHLRLLYQPQIDVHSGCIVGVEALVRWDDAVLGEVPPALFIHVAEESGMILQLSDWVLQTACRQIAAWQLGGTPMRVAVNFSAHQFRQLDLHDKVSAALDLTGAPARLLEVEITESVAMAHPMQARAQLQSLVSLGCSVALDDFGTGYSSLATLKALPITKLKIDRSFIQDIPYDLNDIKISRSIIALAHSMGLGLVAEGVETAEQLSFLRKYNCETYQGWLYSKALTSSEITERLRPLAA
jgi:diguanylate cyclase (GGDEF)-like protein/PAS domain S-box-containing protein